MFQKKTVASIIAGFDKMADDLDAVMARMSDRAKVIDIDIAMLEQESRQCVDESKKAEFVRNNIIAITGGS